MTITVKTDLPIPTIVIAGEGTLIAELIREGGSLSNYYGDDPLIWYIDAAYIEDKDGEKVRDLTDEEIESLQDDSTFCAYAFEAIAEDERDYDPTP